MPDAGSAEACDADRGAANLTLFVTERDDWIDARDFSRGYVGGNPADATSVRTAAPGCDGIAGRAATTRPAPAVS